MGRPSKSCQVSTDMHLHRIHPGVRLTLRAGRPSMAKRSPGLVEVLTLLSHFRCLLSLQACKDDHAKCDGARACCEKNPNANPEGSHCLNHDPIAKRVCAFVCS